MRVLRVRILDLAPLVEAITQGDAEYNRRYDQPRSWTLNVDGTNGTPIRPLWVPSGPLLETEEEDEEALDGVDLANVSEQKDARKIQYVVDECGLQQPAGAQRGFPNSLLRAGDWELSKVTNVQIQFAGCYRGRRPHGLSVDLARGR